MSEEMIQKRLDKKLKLNKALQETTRKNLYDWRTLKSDSQTSFENDSFTRPKSGAKESDQSNTSLYSEFSKKSESFIDLKAHESQGFRVSRSATSSKAASNAKPVKAAADTYGEIDAIIKDTDEYLKELKEKRVQMEREESKALLFQINGTTEEKSALLADELVSLNTSTSTPPFCLSSSLYICQEQEIEPKESFQRLEPRSQSDGYKRDRKHVQGISLPSYTVLTLRPYHNRVQSVTSLFVDD